MALCPCGDIPCSTLYRVEPNVTALASRPGRVMDACSTLYRVEPNVTTRVASRKNLTLRGIVASTNNLTAAKILPSCIHQVLLVQSHAKRRPVKAGSLSGCLDRSSEYGTLGST